MTIIYENAKNLPTNAYGDDGTVAIRITHDPFCQSLIESFGKPIVATSANISGDPLPNHFGEISSAVIIGVDYVVKYRTMDKDIRRAIRDCQAGQRARELVFFRE
ncbi:MAG: Sua5/YciO/YrdC/YwlC family protein [Saprospiraceae bacterium]